MLRVPCRLSTAQLASSLKLSFTNIQGLGSHFVCCQSFFESTSPDIFPLGETGLEESINSTNFSLTGYPPFIRKNSVTHMHGLAVCMSKKLPLANNLSFENSKDSHLRFRLALLHLVSYFFFLYQSHHLLCEQLYY